jgi:hypothetical protein
VRILFTHVAKLPLLSISTETLRASDFGGAAGHGSASGAGCLTVAERIGGFAAALVRLLVAEAGRRLHPFAPSLLAEAPDEALLLAVFGWDVDFLESLGHVSKGICWGKHTTHALFMERLCRMLFCQPLTFGSFPLSVFLLNQS